MKRLKGRYRLIYLELSEEVIIIVRFIENIDQMTAASLKIIEATLLLDIFVNEERDDNAGKNVELSTEKRQKFLQVHEHMNRHFVIEFDYTSACAALGLDSQQSLMSGQYKSQSGSLKTLKLHQVTALHWALDTESAIGGQLIADDMGVGKTVTALSLIMESAYIRGLARPGAAQGAAMLSIQSANMNTQAKTLFSTFL